MRNATLPKLLVIDDDASVAPFLAAKLGAHFQVAATTDPADAVAAALRERPDVILCDINMPGCNGDEVAFLLSQDDVAGRIPLVYLTGLLSPKMSGEIGEQFGDHPAVSKQADTRQLLETLRSVLAAG